MKASRSLLLMACCALIPLLNFPRALLSDQALFQRDINTVWSPQIESVVRQVAKGEPPFFDARRAFGQPLFADPRSEILYPPAWIHWIWPPERSYALFCALHLVIGSMGAARLARRLAPRMGPEGPFIAALGFGAGGPMLSLVAHWHHLAAAAWMPWILAECAPAPDDPRGHKARLALLVALQCLAGSPDYLALTLLLSILRIATCGSATRRVAADALIGAALGLALSAAQILPSLAFASDAARDRLPLGLSLSALHPALALEALVPVRVLGWPLTPAAAASLFDGATPWMLSHYMGFTLWTLSLAGWTRSSREARRFATGAVVLGFLVAGGVQSPVLQDWVSRVPLVRSLRFPSKALVAASLGLSILAAGASTAADRTFRALPRGAALLLAGVTLAATATLWFQGTGGAAAPTALILRVLAPMAIAGAALLSSGLARGAGLLALGVAADLLVSQTRLNPTTPSTLFRDRPPLTAVIPKGARIYTSDYSIRPSGVPTRLPAGVPYRLAKTPVGYSAAEAVALAATWYLAPPVAGRFGYFGSFDLDILDFYRAPLKRSVNEFVAMRDPARILDRLQRGSVDYVVTMDAPDVWRGLVPVTEQSPFFADPVRVYRVPGTWPRARYESAQGALDAEAGAPALLRATDGRLELEASPSRPTHLVVAVANDRGWRATVDGARVPISDNDLAFIRVPLEAGRHRVEISYRPPLLDAGLAISGLALATLVLVARGRAA